MEKIPTALEYIDQHYDESLQTTDFMIEFAKLHVQKIRDIQKLKYYAGETGYIKDEEWKEILDDIK